jgi:hypothetical protein
MENRPGKSRGAGVRLSELLRILFICLSLSINNRLRFVWVRTNPVKCESRSGTNHATGTEWLMLSQERFKAWICPPPAPF